MPNLTGDHENRVTDYTAICVENSGETHGISDTLTATYWEGPGTRNGNEREVIAEAVVYPGVGITSPQNRSNPHPGDPAPSLTSDSRNYLIE